MAALIAKRVAGRERGTAVGAKGRMGGVGHDQETGAPQWPQNLDVALASDLPQCLQAGSELGRTAVCEDGGGLTLGRGSGFAGADSECTGVPQVGHAGASIAKRAPQTVQVRLAAEAGAAEPVVAVEGAGAAAGPMWSSSPRSLRASASVRDASALSLPPTSSRCRSCGERTRSTAS